MKPKLKSMGSLKKKAWRVFSEWVRKRGADYRGYNTCCTCGAKAHWKELHAGHFRHSHSKVTFINEYNVHPQCVKCNHFLSGNLIEYYSFMLKTYGESKVEDLRRLSKKTWKPSRLELEEIIKKYKET